MLATKLIPDIEAHALLDLAAIEMEAKQYKRAADLLKRLRDLSASAGYEPPRDVREQQIYHLGVCQFELEEFPAAIETLEQFISQFPDSRLIASASFFCGEAAYRVGKHGVSVTHFVRVVDEHSSDAVYGPSLLRLGECLGVLQYWPRSQKRFAEYLDRFADSDQWYQARFGLGWAQEHQSRFDDAIGSYEAVVERHQGPTAARAQFQIGECLFAQKKHEEAVSAFLKVDILYAYPEWSAAALYEAGQCFERMAKINEARIAV